MRNLDLAQLDSAPLLREAYCELVRLFAKDFPAGLRRGIHLMGNRNACVFCCAQEEGVLVRAAVNTMRINPEFAGFIHEHTDDGYIQAIKGWVAYKGLLDEEKIPTD